MATGYEKLIAMALEEEQDPRRQLASLVAMPTVSPVAKGSGLGQKATQQGLEKQNVTETRNILLTPEQIDQAVQSAMNTEAVKAQMAGANRMEKLAEVEASAPVQDDYSALVNLADIWSNSGGRLAKGYKAPEDGSAQRARAAGLSAKAQDDRRDMTKSILDFIQKQKAGTQMAQFLSEIKTATEATSEDPAKKTGGRPPAILSDKVREAADKTTKPLSDLAASYASIENILEKPTVQNLGILKSQLARVMAQEKGALAQGDVNRAFPPTLEEKFQRALTLLTSDPGKPLSADLVGAIKEDVARAKQATQELSSSKLSAVKESFRASPGYEDIPIDKIVLPYEQYGSKVTAPKKYFDPAKDKPKTPEEKRARLEYLKSRAGK
jgi:hypothetical protein